MQLRKMTWRLVALGAGVMMLAACGGTELYDLRCSGAEDCLESELCHPDEKVCVQLCTTLVDCPEKAERCEALSDVNPQRICECPTPQCVGERAP
jgi:hypothetical protein